MDAMGACGHVLALALALALAVLIPSGMSTLQRCTHCGRGPLNPGQLTVHAARYKNGSCAQHFGRASDAMPVTN